MIPQAMAYALLGGLPAVTGLYAAVLPPIIYMLFGTSRQGSIGPNALVALLTLQVRISVSRSSCSRCSSVRFVFRCFYFRTID